MRLTEIGSAFFAMSALAGCSQMELQAPPDHFREALAPSSTLGETRLQMGLVTGEARVLRGEQEEKLLWHPARINAVYGYDSKGQRIEYIEGRDWASGASGIRRTVSSRIPDFAGYRYDASTPCGSGWFTRTCARHQLKRLAGNYRSEYGGALTFSFSATPRNPPFTYHYSVYIDYMAEIPQRRIVGQSPDEPATVYCLGDSITRGAQTIADILGGSDADSWCGLLRKQLPHIPVKNLANSGAGIGAMRTRWEQEPDKRPSALLVFAPGMNDHVPGGTPIAEFRRELAGLVSDAQRRRIRIVLVGFFQQNALWADERPALTRQFNDAIEDVAEQAGVPFVDMYRVFERVSGEREAYYHLTADYMHHPNNYGQRLYFSAILPHAMTGHVGTGEIPAYVVAPE